MFRELDLGGLDLGGSTMFFHPLSYLARGMAHSPSQRLTSE